MTAEISTPPTTGSVPLHERLAERILRTLGRDPNGLQLSVVRALLASGTLVTLVFNDPETLFHSPNPDTPTNPACDGFTQYGLFCLLGDTLGLAWAIAIVTCLLMIVGVLHQLVGFAFWYVAASVFANSNVIEGGDQLTGILALVLALVALTDTRLFMWSPRRRPGRALRFIFANVLIIAASAQVVIVYMHSFMAKTSAPFWVDGTALWYWVQHPGFGARENVESSGLAVLANPIVSAGASWGAIGVQLFLALVIAFSHRRRNLRFIALGVGILFHLMIAWAIGLVSFSLAMFAALTLALWRPRDAVPWRYHRLSTRKM